MITGRVALATGDRIALAVSEEEARALLKRRPGAMGDTPQLELLLANEEPTPPPSRTVARTSDTLLTIPADNIAQAKARARARWEEGNDERSELIAAAVPPLNPRPTEAAQSRPGRAASPTHGSAGEMAAAIRVLM